VVLSAVGGPWHVARTSGGPSDLDRQVTLPAHRP